MSKLAILLLLVVVTMAAEKDYTEFVNTIKDNIAKDPFKHSAWNRLAYITDTYGPRMWGSSVL
jgi:cytochrome c oxidase subunit IV